MKKLTIVVVLFAASVLTGACGGDSGSPTAPSPGGSGNGVQTLHFTGTLDGAGSTSKLHSFNAERAGKLRAQLRWTAGPNLNLILTDSFTNPIATGTQTTATEEVLERQINGGTHYLEVSMPVGGRTSYTIDATIQ